MGADLAPICKGQVVLVDDASRAEGWISGGGVPLGADLHPLELDQGRDAGHGGDHRRGALETPLHACMHGVRAHAWGKGACMHGVRAHARGEGRWGQVTDPEVYHAWRK